MLHSPPRSAAANPSVRVLVFPGGGESCTSYDVVLSRLPESVDVCVVSLPGRGPRRDEADLVSVQAIVDAVFSAVRHRSPSCVPLVVVGHSSGAVFAARFVQRAQGLLSISHAVLSSHCSPAAFAEHTLANEQLLGCTNDLAFLQLCLAGGIVDGRLQYLDPDAASFVARPMRADFRVATEALESWPHDALLHVPLLTCVGELDCTVASADVLEWASFFDAPASGDSVRWSRLGTTHLVIPSAGHGFLHAPEHALVWNELVYPGRVSEVVGECVDWYPEQRVEELFGMQARASPNACATIFEGHSTTYRELVRWSAAVADIVAAAARSHEAGAPLRVGIMLPRSDAYVAVMLGALIAGAAFIPVDVAYSTGVLGHILQVTSPCLLFVDDGGMEKLGLIPEQYRRLAILPPARPGSPRDALIGSHASPARTFPAASGRSGPHDDAMIALSSGTTGAPKGIPVSHAAMVHAYSWQARRVPMHSRIAASVFFVWECLRPLLVGGTTVVVPDGVLLDPRLHLRLLEEQRVEDTLVTPSVLGCLLQEMDVGARPGGPPQPLGSLVCVRVCGEVMTPSLAAAFHRQCLSARLFDLYSICEAHDVSSYEYLPGGSVRMTVLPLMRIQVRALSASHITVFGHEGGRCRDVLPFGAVGEVFVAGPGLSRGYIGDGDSGKAFSTEAGSGVRWYATGDLGVLETECSGGAGPFGRPLLKLLGRRKGGMVKLRGHSVVVPAVATTVNSVPGVRAAVVSVLYADSIGKVDVSKPEALCAYVVLMAGVTTDHVRDALASRLHPAWVPAYILELDAIPFSATSQKLDRAMLPDPRRRRESRVAPAAALDTPAGLSRPDEVPLTAPRMPTVAVDERERVVREAWQAALGTAPMSVTSSNFFECGGNSLSAAAVTQSVRRAGWDVSVADLYAHPTPAEFASVLKPMHVAASSLGTNTVPPNPRVQQLRCQTLRADHRIAIVGASCSFPACPSLHEYWRAVCADAPPSETAVHKSLREQAEQIDHAWWGLSKAEADLIEPQHRWFMSHCMDALCDAGYAQPPQSTGVFGGCYLTPGASLCAAGTGQSRPSHFFETGTDKDYLCTRVAHLLDLRGPAITIQTSCSTSLVAVATACRSLASGECDMALAGASSLLPLEARARYAADANPLAPPPPPGEDLHSTAGVVRAFDAQADGTVLGDGVGVVVLKRLSDAVAAGDSVLGVVRGWAINNDGRASDKRSFLAPSALGQEQCMWSALMHADCDAADVGMVEAHGTGTVVGDAIEVRALERVYGRASVARGRQLFVGSCKPTVGHANIAAGMASIIKAALCVSTRTIPPLHRFNGQPGSVLQASWSGIRFAGARESGQSQWPASIGALAAVSCFGVGGTNCHMILEAPPAADAVEVDPRGLRDSLARYSSEHTSVELPLCIAMHTQDALDQLIVATQSVAHDIPPTVAAGWTLTQRLSDPWRAVSLTSGKTWMHGDPTKPPAVVLLFPGQGSLVRPVSAAVLLARASCWATHWNRVRGVALTATGVDIDDPRIQEQAENEQLLLVALQLVRATSIIEQLDENVVRALVGHSIGLLTAMCIAGRLSEQQVLQLALARGRAVAICAGAGSMLACTGRDAVAVPTQVALAGVYVAVDALPASLVLAGTQEDIVRADAHISTWARASELDVHTAPVQVDRAYHTHMMAEAAKRFETAATAILRSEASQRAPLLTRARHHVMCNITGRTVEARQERSPAFWRDHLLRPVLLGECLRNAACVVREREPSSTLWLDVGPGTSMAGLAARLFSDDTTVRSAPSTKDSADVRACVQAWWQCICTLWAHGASSIHRHSLRSLFLRDISEWRWGREHLPRPWLVGATGAETRVRTFELRFQAPRRLGADPSPCDCVDHAGVPAIAIAATWFSAAHYAVACKDVLVDTPSPAVDVAGAPARPSAFLAIIGDEDVVGEASEHEFVQALCTQLPSSSAPLTPHDFPLIVIATVTNDRIGHFERIATPIVLSSPGARLIVVELAEINGESIRKALQSVRRTLAECTSRVARLTRNGLCDGRELIESDVLLHSSPSPSQDFYRHHTFVVQGGTGYIGAELVRQLHARGAGQVAIASRHSQVDPVRSAMELASLVNRVKPLGVFLCATAYPSYVPTSGACDDGRAESAFLAECAVKRDCVRALSQLLEVSTGRPSVVVCFSSLAALLGGATTALGVYGAANAAMCSELVAARQKHPRIQWLNIHWDNWDNVPDFPKQRAIPQAQGVQWLLHTVSSNCLSACTGNQIIASADVTLGQRVVSWEARRETQYTDRVDNTSSIVDTVIACFRSALADPTVTLRSAFASHGGDSVAALTLVALLHRAGIHTSVEQVLQSRTPHNLCRVLTRQGAIGGTTVFGGL